MLASGADHRLLEIGDQFAIDVSITAMESRILRVSEFVVVSELGCWVVRMPGCRNES